MKTNKCPSCNRELPPTKDKEELKLQSIYDNAITASENAYDTAYCLLEKKYNKDTQKALYPIEAAYYKNIDNIANIQTKTIKQANKDYINALKKLKKGKK